MLIRQETLAGIADGRITLAFRRWKRPTVRAGGTLLTSIGQLGIDSVDEVDPAAISDTDARAAGFSDAGTLRALLERRHEGGVYRVALRLAGPDPRIALREERPTADALDEITGRLERWDRSSPVGPWTGATLSLLAERPGLRAGDLADQLGMAKDRFKANVRKLKGLGLTESLQIGYRLSVRGRAVLDHVTSVD